MENQIVMVEPSALLAEDNIRFGLKKARIDELAQNILETGEVLDALEVEPLDKPQGKAAYRITDGFYRHAAVAQLNAEQAAGLKLPIVVRTVDPLSRAMHQITHNAQREDMSPMDTSAAIKKLFDLGVERKEIRRIFARPTGKKGESQPASNAWVNIMVRLLDLPKSIQEKIHSGVLPIGAAYELGRVTPDKRAAVLARAEAGRMAQLAQEQKDEEKYLQSERKLTEAQSKVEEAAKTAEALKAEIETAAANVKATTEALREVQKQPYMELDDAGKKRMTEACKAAEANVKGAQKIEKDLRNKLAKTLEKTHAVEEAAEKASKALEAARKAVKAKKGKAAGPGADDIKKAAAAEGEGSGFVPLTASEMRLCVKDLAKLEATPKVAAIGALLVRAFSGELTTKEVSEDLAVLTGELRRAAAPKKK